VRGEYLNAGHFPSKQSAPMTTRRGNGDNGLHRRDGTSGVAHYFRYEPAVDETDAPVYVCRRTWRAYPEFGSTD
jgi:hypothetical protein